jgi:hypothetical protein
MSPVFDPSKWSLPVSVVVSLIGLTVAGAAGVFSIHARLDRIEQTLRAHDRDYIAAAHFDKWQSRTEKLSPPWQGADMDAIRE